VENTLSHSVEEFFNKSWDSHPKASFLRTKLTEKYKVPFLSPNPTRPADYKHNTDSTQDKQLMMTPKVECSKYGIKLTSSTLLNLYSKMSCKHEKYA